MGRSGKREAIRIELTGDVMLFPIAGGKSQPAQLAEVSDVSRGGAALVVNASSATAELSLGRRLALRLVTANGSAGVLLHCEVCRTYPIDQAHTRVGVRFLHVLKDGRAHTPAA